MSSCALIVMYHYVRNLKLSRYPRLTGLDVALFREQIAYLKQNFTILTNDQFLSAVTEGCRLPPNSLYLTFDDGYIDHYTEVFPILKENRIEAFFSMPGKIVAEQKLLDVNKIHFILASTDSQSLLKLVYERLDHYRGSEHNIPPNAELYEKLAQANRFDTPETIFIKRLLQVELEENLRNVIVQDLFHRCIGCDERTFAHELYMSIDQARLMKREGMCFGIHGYDHYWMNKLSPRELECDIKKALECFTEIVPKDWICCYPYGSRDANVAKQAQALGAIAGFSTRVAVADFREDLFDLPRFDTNDFPPKSHNYINYRNEKLME